jgi:MFS family permease
LSALTRKPLIVLYLVSLTQFLGYGILYYSSSILILPIVASNGWTEAQVSGVFSLSLLMSGVLSVPVGWWLDRFGPPKLLRLGSAMLPVLLFAVPFITHLGLFYLLWALIGGCMALVLYETAFKIVAALPIKPERAFSTLTFITGSSGLVFVPLGEWIVTAFTWQSMIWLYAAVILMVTVPVNFWLANETKVIPTVSRGSSDYSWMYSKDAVVLIASFFFNTFATSAVLVMGVVWMVKQGFTSAFAAGILALVGAMSLPGRLSVNIVSRFKTPQHLLGWLVALQAASLVLAVAGDSEVLFYVFAVLFGFSLGSITPLRAFIIKAEYEAVGLGVANGVIAFITTLARASGPVVGGWMFTRGLDARWFTLLLAGFSVISLGLIVYRIQRKRRMAAVHL